MNINATFFIQLFHFLIGYLILERLLLRPWFNVIDHEAQQRLEQEQLLNIAQQQVAHKEHFKKEQWREFQVSFAQAMPHVPLEPNHNAIRTSQGRSAQSINHTHVNACQKEVEQSLFARLTHV